MAEHTKIAWASGTVNWWWGCTEVGPGCDHCYARTLAKRLRGIEWGDAAPRERIAGARSTLVKIVHRARREKTRLKVFTNSMSDFFDRLADPAWRREAWDAMREFWEVDYLILTKRPENILAMLPPDWGTGWPHVWLGVTVENNAALKRCAILRRVPCALRWVSYEPALEYVSFGAHLPCDEMASHDSDADEAVGGDIRWVVVGGESTQGGAEARPFDVEWARKVIRECRTTDAVPFVKQLGSKPFYVSRNENCTTLDDTRWVPIVLKSKAGSDPAEWAPDLRVQEWPTSPAEAVAR